MSRGARRIILASRASDVCDDRKIGENRDGYVALRHRLRAAASPGPKYRGECGDCPNGHGIRGRNTGLGFHSDAMQALRPSSESSMQGAIASPIETSMQVERKPYELLVQWDADGNLLGAHVRWSNVVTNADGSKQVYPTTVEPVALTAGDKGVPIADVLNEARSNPVRRAINSRAA
jgi:hypothetical protein